MSSRREEQVKAKKEARRREEEAIEHAKQRPAKRDALREQGRAEEIAAGDYEAPAHWKETL